jgi:TPR repeat protein
MYADGRGVSKDDQEAVKWFTLAAVQGYAQAQTKLGVMHRRGTGLPQNDVEAAKWFRLAAEQGYSQAQTNLGFMHQKGNGVALDYSMAHMWYSLAASKGNQDGLWGRAIIIKKMTQEDISKAQAMARKCMNSGYQECGY